MTKEKIIKYMIYMSLIMFVYMSVLTFGFSKYIDHCEKELDTRKMYQRIHPWIEMTGSSLIIHFNQYTTYDELVKFMGSLTLLECK